MELLQVFFDSLKDTASWVWALITGEVVWYENYFWGLILISLAVYLLEICLPWRKDQSILRKDFFLDLWYMFFNFFVFSIAISGLYAVAEHLAGQVGWSMNSLAILNTSNLSPAVQLLLFFVVLDFVQWLTHMGLHKIPVLWRFHQVHHSVREMGFAAHLRYHWMENILYKPLKTLALMLLGGFEPEQAFIVHFLAITIGHLNHANVKFTYGPLKYVFNNPVMHLYHHARELPPGRFGVNFGISLSVWDYLAGHAYIPEDSGTIPIGYDEDRDMPTSFLGQLKHGFSKKG